MSKSKNWWLYVLKLEQGKWYVGITANTPEKRFRQHKNGFAGAAWTKKYKPLEIHDTKNLGICSLEQAQLFEGRATRKYMEKYGDNNVRGGDLISTDDYVRRFGWLWPKGDWETLTALLLFMLLSLYLLIDKFFLS